MTRPRHAFVYLVALFLLPVLLSWAYFYFVSNFGSNSQINYGKLIIPPITTATQNLVLLNAEGDKTFQPLPNKWTLGLLNFADTCNQPCQQTVQLLTRIRALQGEEIKRVQNLLVTNFPDAGLAKISKQNSNFLLLNRADGTFNDFINRHWQQQTNTIILLDPLGNIMMQYPINNPDIRKIINDFKRLLKYSRIG